MIWDILEESTFDLHFSTQNLQIDSLLLDENIITEFKNVNPKLMSLYPIGQSRSFEQHQTQFILKMIKYCTCMPVLEDGYDRCHKLPYISSEILAIDSDIMFSPFFVEEGDNQFWAELLKFLETSAVDNEILMGYFEKVVTSLYNQNKTTTTNIICQHFQLFIANISKPSIGDILKKSIILLNTPEQAVLQSRKKILSNVIQKFLEANQYEKSICSEILVEVISKFQTFSSGDAIMEQILKSEKVLKWFSLESLGVTNLMVGILNKSKQEIVNENDEKISILPLPESYRSIISSYISKQAKRVIVESLQPKEHFTNQSKQIVTKTNKDFFIFLNLINLGLEVKIHQFVDAELIESCWEMIRNHPFNDILIVSVNRFFLNVLRNKQVGYLFSGGFHENALKLAKCNLKMYKPHIFTLWKEIQLQKVTIADPELSEWWKQFEQKELTPLLRYEINKNQLKCFQHQPLHHKLVVDQQDAAPSYQLSNHQAKQIQNTQDQLQMQNTQDQLQIQNHHLSQIEPIPKQIPPQKQTILQNDANKQQKKDDAFDFFNSFAANNKPKAQETKSEFDEFESFF